MNTVTLGQRTDINTLGMGTWHLGDHKNKRKQEIDTLRIGIENGIQIIDTAEMYGDGRAECLVGEVIRVFVREDLYLVSKVLPHYANARDMEGRLDQTLQRLGVDYLDLYLYHWPGTTPLFETVATFEQLKTKGKIKDWGVSNFDTEDMQHLLALPDGDKCLVNQVLYHLGERGIEYDLKPLLDEHGIMTMAYCPLAQAGRLQAGLIEHPTVQAIADDLQITPYQVLLSWVLAQPQMIALPRTGNPHHMRDNLACNTIRLSDNQYQALDQAFPAPNYKTPLVIE